MTRAHLADTPANTRSDHGLRRGTSGDLAELVRHQRAHRAAGRLDLGPKAATAGPRAALARVRRRLGGPPTVAEPVPSAAIVALNRLAFGPRPGDLEAFQALGTSDEARLAAYVEQQLDPASIDDSELETRLSAAGFTTLGKSARQLWQDHHRGDPDWAVRVRPLVEVERATFLRAIYSRRQLVEVLADHWHDHFNVYAWEYIAAPTWAAYDRDCIRAHVLGNFREMLEAVAKSPAMLVYLDNYANHVAGPNENWARELFELHTLGAAHYFGVRRQHEVPRDPHGVPRGYVDDDVYEATRCFTGWTLDEETGEVAFPADWHDRFQKWVLGTYLPPNRTAAVDGGEVLDLVAAHPATAQHVAWRLCRRLIADAPPQPVVDAAAAAFLAHRHSPHQLREVVRTIVLAPQFRLTWGQKVKRPFELVASALRALGAELSFALDDELTDALLWLFEHTGHARFAWRPPDGYPDQAHHWLSTGTLVSSWRLLNWLIDADSGKGGHAVAVLPPAGVGTSAAALADWWIARVYGRPMPASFRQEVVAFMAQGRGSTVPLPVATDSDTEERLRAMVALLFIAPEFLRR